MTYPNDALVEVVSLMIDHALTAEQVRSLAKDLPGEFEEVERQASDLTFLVPEREAQR